MSKNHIRQGYNTDAAFQGLIPGDKMMDTDWDVEMGHRTGTAWMSDAKKKQSFTPSFANVPFMAPSFDNVDDDQTPRPSDDGKFPHPDLALPRPGLTHDFRMSVTLNPAISVGKIPFGERRWISFTGGSWSASFGSGTVAPGGQDSQIIVADLSTRVETNYLLQTNDDPPAFIVAKTQGWRTGPRDVLADLLDPQKANNVDPASYLFRIFIDLETGDERYREKINYGMWLGSGMRKGAEVVYDAYRIS